METVTDVPIRALELALPACTASDDGAVYTLSDGTVKTRKEVLALIVNDLCFALVVQVKMMILGDDSIDLTVTTELGERRFGMKGIAALSLQDFAEMVYRSVTDWTPK